MHFLITRSIVFDQDLDFDIDLAQFGDPWQQPKTVTGKKNMMQQIGPSLIWAPLLAIAHVLAVVANVFGADIDTHGYTLFHQRIQDIGFGVVLAIELALAAVKARDVKPVLWGAIPLALALVMFVPQLYVWKVYYDSWLTTPQVPGQMRYSHPMFAEFLWSSRNG